MAEDMIDKLTAAELSLLAIIIRNQITPSGVARDWKDIKNFGHIASVWRSRTDSQDSDEEVRELGYEVMRQAIKMGLLQKDQDGQQSWVGDVSGCTNGRDLRDALASRATNNNGEASGDASKGKGKGKRMGRGSANKNALATTQKQHTAPGGSQTHDNTSRPGQAAPSTQGTKKATAAPRSPPFDTNKGKNTPIGPHGPPVSQSTQDVQQWLKIYPAEGVKNSMSQSSKATTGGSDTSEKISQNLKEQTQLLGLVAMGKLSPDGQKRLKRLQEEYQAEMKGAVGKAGEGSL